MGIRLPLSRFNTLGIGGKAEIELLRSKESVSELSERGCGEGDVLLGRGSKVLLSPSVKRVFVCRADGLCADGTTVYAECGVSLARLASFALSLSLTGLEWASSIPGTVGGALIMNAGAFGGDMASSVREVEVASLGKRRCLTAEQCGFRYRSSSLKAYGAVLSAEFSLERGKTEDIVALTRAQTERRKRTQPSGKSAGSVFKRVDGVSAGYYIEKAGLKGERRGGAVISEKHANFIINDGNANFYDVLALICLCERAVYEKFGIRLEREILVTGDY